MSKKANPIIQSWKSNAQRWIKIIEDDAIESRRLVTNAAILAIILKYQPTNVLDVGCGEGWLVRALMDNKIKAYGIDATKALIKKAKEGKGNFDILSYKELTKGVTLPDAPFDIITINFALFEKKGTTRLLKKLPEYLTPNGKIIIQTMHPFSLQETDEYKSAWREDAWAGLNGAFTDPFRWYARTLEDWFKVFQKAGLTLKNIKEPIHPKTKKPASIIFVL
jgi:2-polyprenyl-3-methyl-5-hydroxy-6-metoxy-1,4-benzoquinol methylase